MGSLGRCMKYKNFIYVLFMCIIFSFCSTVNASTYWYQKPNKNNYWYRNNRYNDGNRFYRIKNKYYEPRRYHYTNRDYCSNNDKMYQNINYNRSGSYKRTYNSTGIFGLLFGYKEKESIEVDVD